MYTTTVLQMVEDLDMENEHETGVETWHRSSSVEKMEMKELSLTSYYC